jgi:hypothetical protein
MSKLNVNNFQELNNSSQRLTNNNINNNQINNEPQKPLGKLPMFNWGLTKEKQNSLINSWTNVLKNN